MGENHPLFLVRRHLYLLERRKFRGRIDASDYCCCSATGAAAGGGGRCGRPYRSSRRQPAVAERPALWLCAYAGGWGRSDAALPGLAELASGWAFVLSVVLFSGVQIAKIMMAGIPLAPTPLDGLTFLIPVGGVAFITGWLLMGLSAAMASKPVLKDEQD